MNNFSELEIRDSLKNWKDIISKYQIPSKKKATIQLINSFLPFVGLWIAMYFSLSWSIWLTIGLAFINAFFLVRIFIIQHDCGHQSFFRSRKWNNAIGTLCSFFSSIPYKYWAKVHNHHHGHSGQLEMEHRDIGDIRFLTVEEYNALPGWRQFSYRLFRSPIVLFGFAPFIYLTVSNRYPFFKLKGWGKVRMSQLRNNLLMVTIYGLLIYFLGWKVLIIQLPIIFLFSIIAFWFFYVQHQHEETYKEWLKNWDFLMASLRGATYYKLPKLFHWLTGNIGYHHIHHLSSLIPNYNLERCYKENPILNKYVTSITFTESLKCIRNNLWDQNMEKMISFKEYKLLYKAI